MINNRQGGRRRGRGGQRGQNLGGQPGNRQDNRQRGNAAQLLEKYKSLARDAQLAGDRVQTEYYLQYADHYFRILSENRSRFDDQRRPRDDSDSDEGEELVEAGEAETEVREEERHDRGDRGDGRERFNRRDRDRDRSRFGREQRGDGDGESEESGDSGNGRDDGSLPLDVLPPASGADSAPLVSEEPVAPAPRKRSRTRRPSEGDDEVAPAA